MCWWVYIIRSQATDKLYTGIAKDPVARLHQHNAGKGAKYTRSGRPWRIVFKALVPNKSDALRLEARIKKLNRTQKLTLIERAAIDEFLFEVSREGVEL